MKRTYEKDNRPVTSSVKPTTLNLQTRPFAPLQSDLSQVNEMAEGNSIQDKGASSENLLEKLISTPITESSATSIRRKPFSSKRMPIQAKLNIGEPDDKYEKEADNTAAKVVQQISSSSQDSSVQKQEIEEDEELQRSPISTLQREEDPIDEDEDENEEELQMKPLLQKRENLGGGEASSNLESSIQSVRGSGHSLDTNLQLKMEQSMGADFSKVKVHTDLLSNQLNQSIQAKAFTTGQDIFFGQGEYNPNNQNGQELIAHELTHVVQQNGSSVQKSSLQKIQRKFNPAKVTSNAHLRSDGDWDTYLGPQINKNSFILADDDQSKIKTQSRTVRKDVKWIPAVNIPPDSKAANIPASQQGYIRKGRIGFQPNSLEDILRARVVSILSRAESKHASLAGHINKKEVVDFLMKKALRYDTWGTSNLDIFTSGFGSKEDKLTRIVDGANYVADSLEHWRAWLHPQKPEDVTITNVKFLESDLHEKGLGVLMVKFNKPVGSTNPQYANETAPEVVIKPEDKSLEKNLLGDDPTSAVNKINEIVGLTDPSESLATIKMACDAQYGTIVEKVKGTKAEDLVGHSNLRIDPAFHETLVFAFLTGLDDLHGENVYWYNGKPYLIDADNVLSYNQMIQKDNGAFVQSGFGSNYSTEEGKKNMAAIKTGDNKINSKILQAMMDSPVKARKIIDVIKGAITGKEGRVVPIKTGKWGRVLGDYVNYDHKVVLDSYSTSDFIVRETTGFDSGTGPGLFGTTFKNVDNPFYDAVAERKELQKDFDAGVIPFYTYDYTTGHVTHNGKKIYHGQTLEQAMNVMINKFSPFWDQAWDDYMGSRVDDI
jgi:hypothetical protein